MPRFVCAALALAALAAAPASALNFTLSLRNDRRRVVDAGVFGYNGGGVLELLVDEVSMEVPANYGSVVAPAKDGKPATPAVGLVLDRVASTSAARRPKKFSGVCFPDDDGLAPPPTGRTIFPLPDAVFQSPGAPLKSVRLGGTLRKLQLQIRQAGLYALYFYHCVGRTAQNSKGSTAQATVVNADTGAVMMPDAAVGPKTTLKIDVRQYNPTGPQSSPYDTVSYLPFGEANLPAMYGLFSVLFLALTVAWYRALAAAPKGSPVQPIHYGMLVLCTLKCLELFAQSLVYSHRGSTGALKYGADYIFFFFSTLKGIVLFTVILLLGTGWSILKPFLGERDKTILMVLLPLQVISHVAQAVTTETSEGTGSWQTWHFALRLFDVACCCAVLIPVILSIKSLNDPSTGDRGRRRAARLKQFRGFYIAVIAFVYFTRIVFPYLNDSAGAATAWLPYFMYESCALCFYVYAGMLFRPGAEQEVMKEMQDDVDEIVIGTDDEDAHLTGRVELTQKEKKGKEGMRRKEKPQTAPLPPMEDAGEIDLDDVLGPDPQPTVARR